MLAVLVFVLGAIVGSFLNVCIYRLPRKESIVNPPSHCISCNKAIKWFDNIPIVSFVILKGKCRFCKMGISLRYPVVETLSGLAGLLLFLHLGITPKFFILWFLSCALIVASFIDLAVHEIPDLITLPGVVAGVGLAALYPPLLDKASSLSSFLDSFLGVILGGGSIYILGFIGEFIFKKEAMGGGDVKLLAMIGSFIGWKMALFTFFLAPFFGSVVGIVLKLKEGRDVIPYGPYLSLAAFVSIFYGETILRKLFLL